MGEDINDVSNKISIPFYIHVESTLLGNGLVKTGI